jgi:sulfonate transport system permease protein
MSDHKISNRFWLGFEYFGLLIAIVILWATMEHTGQINTVILPAPGSVVQTFKQLVADGSLLTNLGISILRVLKGYALAAVLGVTLGIVLGLFPKAERATELIIQIVRPIPPIAWIPLVILWFGIGESGKIFLIFLGGFFTILINVIDGIHQTDPKWIEVSRAMETPFLKHVFTLVIPAAAPNIFTGLRVGLGTCWTCVVAAELVASTTGVGYMIMNARQFGQTDVIIVGMLAIGIVGKIMDALLKLIEAKVVSWPS